MTNDEHSGFSIPSSFVIRKFVIPAAAADRTKAVAEVLKRWDSLRGETLGGLNSLLKQVGLPAIVVKQPKEKIEREGPDDFEP